MIKDDNEIKYIRITKKYSLKEKIPENFILLSKGSNKIQISLNNNKINQRQILESLNTIHNNQILDDDKIYYTSYKNNNSNNYTNYIQFTSNDHIELSIKNKRKNFNDLLIYTNKTTNIKKSKIANIYNLNSEVNKNIILLKKNKNKQNFNNCLKKESKESERPFIKQNSKNKKNINIFLNYGSLNKTENINEIKLNKTTKKINPKLSYNNSKNVMSGNNSNLLDNNNIDKISGLVDIKNNIQIFENLSDYKNNNNNLSSFDIFNCINHNNSDRNCIICERTYLLKFIYFSNCNKHFFCKHCLKIYFEDLIDKGITKMKCPVFNCNYEINDNILRKILDKKYYQNLYNKKNQKIEDEDKKIIISDISKNKKLDDDKNKSNNISKNLDKYQYSNVLDINKNNNLLNFIKHKDEFCPRCHEISLYQKTNSLFYKCLNCGYKICKYCYKEYNNNHFIMNNSNHCKVFYRRNRRNISKNVLLNYLYQILYIIGMFIIMLIYCFVSINSFFLLIFGIKNKNSSDYSCIWYTKYFISYIFSIFFCLIILPFFGISIPFFPILIALIDGY